MPCDRGIVGSARIAQHFLEAIRESAFKQAKRHRGAAGRDLHGEFRRDKSILRLHKATLPPPYAEKVRQRTSEHRVVQRGNRALTSSRLSLLVVFLLVSLSQAT